MKKNGENKKTVKNSLAIESLKIEAPNRVRDRK
jgi:hypothetical protein